jgi:transposase
MEKQIVYSIGVDLHKDSMTIVVLDAKGSVSARDKIPTKCKNRVREYFSAYGLQCQVAVESVGFYHWFWEIVRPVVGKMILADPAGVKAYCGRRVKTDRNDAHLLAVLAFEGKVPAAYVPEEPVRSLRELVRLRHIVARDLAGARKRLRWVSLKTNMPGPKDLTSDRAQKWILAIDEKFSAVHRSAARFYLDRIVGLERGVADLGRHIEEKMLAHPETSEIYRLLMTIPGVGSIAAATIITETGDITRFDNINQLSAYAGLCPRVSQSGESVRHGHISKMGPPVLRWILQQAAWVAYRSDDTARRIVLRIARRAGLKRAITAMARKTLSYAWSVARNKKPFKWPEHMPASVEKKTVIAFENPIKTGRREGV